MLQGWLDDDEGSDSLRRFAWEKLYELSAPPPTKSEAARVPKAGELSDAELVEYVRARLEKLGG